MEKLLCFVAKKTTSREILELLAKCPYLEVIKAVIDNPNTPYKKLTKLAKDNYRIVRSAARENLKMRN